MRKRGPDQHYPGDRPEEYQRLPVEQRENEGDDSVDQEGGKQPG